MKNNYNLKKIMAILRNMFVINNKILVKILNNIYYFQRDFALINIKLYYIIKGKLQIRIVKCKIEIWISRFN